MLEKNSIEALVTILRRRKELSNLDNLKGFSMYLGGNCPWVPLSTIAQRFHYFLYPHSLFFFSLFTLGHFAIFRVCSLVPALRLRLGGSSEIHG